MSYALPEKFKERMREQLPAEEREAFFAEYGENARPPYKGIRVNALKCSAEEFARIAPFPLSGKTPWEENGFYVSEEKAGAYAYHFAGLYYSQEPSAMSAAPLLDAKPFERVLDLCSAPGGKGTQLAAAMDGKGLIVLNEPVFSRAQILLENVERMGIKNAVVLSELPAKLSGIFPFFFDKILVDAPCSGEGMFRKNAAEAFAEWSEENVKMCAARQREILNEATKMLAFGGRLVYSTCTFSEEEDEGQVCDYLQNHPEMRLLESKKLYPHRCAGEGHFAALFEKNSENADSDSSSENVRPAKASCGKESERLYRAFEKSVFNVPIVALENLHEAAGALYALPEGMFDWRDVKLLRAGVKLGEIKNGRFEPAHALVMSVKMNECKNVLNLPLHDARLEKFLHGETVETGESEKIQNGWCAVCVAGYPIGWGKCVNGVVKNHIPKALRKAVSAHPI